ncbi:homoserine kinase [Solitalea koreensis]|uniref:Homoserine kinase n=1 Tax=Solitalea koreensis TaxID=543615 RepID=A0A521B1Y1_9SPHI|nr:homoserine kinase [Solitalea koreensis]SMO41097.1 homoserine kinase [Solitalea koreensis]
MSEIKTFTPGTVANVSCGFDVLGFALDSPGDEMVLRRTVEKTVKITRIDGYDLPKEPLRNVAGVALLAMLKEYRGDAGFEIEIYKKIKPGSGIGSSAASAAGVVVAANKLLGEPFSKTELVRFAMEGERLASGVAHADNIAPAIFGGFTLVRSYAPLDIITLDTPSELFATVIHPQIEVRTADAREILKKNVLLKDAIKQWGNVGGLVAGLMKSDYGLISRSLEDAIVEPIRSILIPAFQEVKLKSKEAGALGGGISGSGPSIFMLSKGEEAAQQVKMAMADVYEKVGIDFDIHLSKVNQTGVKVIAIKENNEILQS